MHTAITEKIRLDNSVCINMKGANMSSKLKKLIDSFENLLTAASDFADAVVSIIDFNSSDSTDTDSPTHTEK